MAKNKSSSSVCTHHRRSSPPPVVEDFGSARPCLASLSLGISLSRRLWPPPLSQTHGSLSLSL
uniref:Uncharacterized protein n=1 Tax=Fagus sylvatica TaxID=28930 RepID=A0A2N9GGR6_FAGSY